MKIGGGIGSWKDDFRALQVLIAGELGVVSRMRRIVDAWLDRPYVADSLIGGPQEPESLVINLQAFDCVTFVESALALARSLTPQEFIQELSRTRYHDGRVDWVSRLHYFSDWLKYNQGRGAIRVRTRGRGSRSIQTALATLEGLSARQVRFHVVPKKNLHLARRRISDGSIVGFASLRPKLDFFHTGLLFCHPQAGIMLYHASRTAMRVTAEPLEAYLMRNRMRGLAFAIPLNPGAPR